MTSTEPTAPTDAHACACGLLPHEHEGYAALVDQLIETLRHPAVSDVT